MQSATGICGRYRYDANVWATASGLRWLATIRLNGRALEHLRGEFADDECAVCAEHIHITVSHWVRRREHALGFREEA